MLLGPEMDISDLLSGAYNLKSLTIDNCTYDKIVSAHFMKKILGYNFKGLKRKRFVAQTSRSCIKLVKLILNLEKLMERGRIFFHEALTYRQCTFIFNLLLNLLFNFFSVKLLNFLTKILNSRSLFDLDVFGVYKTDYNLKNFAGYCY